MDMLENNHYSYKDDKHYLEIWANNPDNSFAASVQHGVFEFALYKQREVLLFYYRIKNVMDSWQSIPFNIHFSEDNEIVLPRYTFLAHDKAKLHISLIDTKTEKTKVTRTVSLSRDFSLELASIAPKGQAIFGDERKPDVSHCPYRAFEGYGGCVPGAVSAWLTSSCAFGAERKESDYYG